MDTKFVQIKPFYQDQYRKTLLWNQVYDFLKLSLLKPEDFISFTAYRDQDGRDVGILFYKSDEAPGKEKKCYELPNKELET